MCKEFLVFYVCFCIDDLSLCNSNNCAPRCFCLENHIMILIIIKIILILERVNLTKKILFELKTFNFNKKNKIKNN